jgi:hypothetical protein
MKSLAAPIFKLTEAASNVTRIAMGPENNEYLYQTTPL